MLEAAATAINLIESNVVRPGGQQATLFRPESDNGFTNGLHTEERKQEPADYWQEMRKIINEAVVEARHNPEAARTLFALASYGRRDPESLVSLRTLFTQEGIPQEFLSHYVPDNPFA